MSDLDDFMKHIGAPADLGSGKPTDPAKAPPPTAAPTGGSDRGALLDVGRGVGKSLVGTGVGLSRLANEGIGLIRPSWSSELGSLAERVPGVKSAEDFADSPNETTAESVGYWGGEAAQFLLPTDWLKIGQYGGKLADLAHGVKTIDAGEMMAAARAPKAAEAATKAATDAPKAATDAPKAGEFTSTGNKDFDAMIQATRAERKAGEAETGQGMGASARALDAQRASETAAPLRFIEDPPPRRPPGPGFLGRSVRGGLAGAAANPQDPGTGFITGGLTGGLASPLGQLAQSRIGQYLSGLMARGASFGAVLQLAETYGIPRWLSLPYLIGGWHSPIGRAVDRFGRAATRVGGRALERAPTRAVGAATGAGSRALDSASSGWTPEPPPETSDDGR